MRVIREITEEELGQFLRITSEAFPGMRVVTEDDHLRMQERLRRIMDEPIVHFLALFEDEEMVGVMRTYDFTMKLRSVRTLVGGLGGVAVDLRHKREHVAFDMVQHFHAMYRAKGACLTALYPFRPDFYRQMGYGFGTRMNRYVLDPATLPRQGRKDGIVYLNAADKDALHACYDRLVERTNGLIELPPHVLDGLFNDAAALIVGCRTDGELTGYLLGRLVPTRDDNFLANNLEIRALVYDDNSALEQLLAFVRSQADQVGRVVWETQDDMVPFLSSDPRNGTGNLLAGLWHETNTQGTGIMYRVIDIIRLFEVLEDHEFGDVSCRLALEVEDTFLPETGGRTVIYFDRGRAQLMEAADPVDVTLTLEVGNLASLITGAISARQLLTYGLASLSDPSYADTVHRLFFTEHKPWCMTHF